MFQGTRVKIGDDWVIIPPLSLGQLRSGALDLLREHDKLIAEGKTFEAMDLRAKVIFTALQRNYPDFEEAKLLNFLDMANTGPLWLVVLGASGFISSREGGNGLDPTAAIDGTLSQSIAVSPPPTVGPISK